MLSRINLHSLLVMLILVLSQGSDNLSANSTISTLSLGVWLPFTSPTTDRILSIAMVESNNGWMVASCQCAINGQWQPGHIFRWNGTAWSPAGTITLSQWGVIESDIAMVSADDGWIIAGSRYSDPPQTSTIMRWNGSSWMQFPACDDVSLSALDMISATDGWAVGKTNFGTKYYHWDGSAWQYVSYHIGIYANSDIDMVSDTDGWAIGDSTIMRFNEDTWVNFPDPVSTSLNSIAMTSPTDGWIVGGEGTILRWNGSVWTQVASPVTTNLKSVTMTSATDGWAVGGGYNFSTDIYEPGVILYWDGTNWTQVTCPVTYGLNLVRMSSATDGWISGGGGYNGQGFDPITMLRYCPSFSIYLPLIQR